MLLMCREYVRHINEILTMEIVEVTIFCNVIDKLANQGIGLVKQGIELITDNKI